MTRTPLRVGIDCTVAGRPQTGFEAYVLGLAGALAQLRRDDLEVVLFVSRPVPEPFAGLRGRFSTIASPCGRDVFANQIWLTSALRKGRVDLMHYPAFPPLWPPRNFVMTVHDATPWKFGDTMPRKTRLYFRSSLGLWVRRSRLIITPSEASRREVIEQFGVPPAQVKAIHLGLRSALRTAGLEVRGGRGREDAAPGHLLFVGTVEPRKNLAVVVRALTRLRARGVRRRLVVAGRPGWGAAELQRIVEQERAGDLVRLAGHVSDEELAGLYRRAGCLVQPSLHEGFGYPVLEAMALRCPVIASGIPAHREVLGDAGLYFPPADDRALAEAIAQLEADAGLRSHLVDAGSRRAERFTWSAAAERTLEVYQAALQ